MVIRKSGNFWEGPGARLIALALIVISIASLGYIHRDDLFPPDAQKAETGLNPEYLKCRKMRVGQIDKMRVDNTINASQHESFKRRALSFCAGRYPPDSSGVGNRPPAPPRGFPKNRK